MTTNEKAADAAKETHGMKPVALMFAVANAAVLAIFVGLVATGWIEFGVTAVAATPAG